MLKEIKSRTPDRKEEEKGSIASKQGRTGGVEERFGDLRRGREEVWGEKKETSEEN